MITREANANDNISKPGLIFELMGIKVGRAHKYKSDATFELKLARKQR